MDMEWSSEAALILVKEYEKHEELWNKDHNMYRVSTVKNAAWTAIARIFNCETIDVRKKCNSILASYRRERAKVKERGRSFWFLYQHLKFLPGYVPSPALDESIEQETATEHYEQVETLEEYITDDTQASEDDQQEMEVKIKHEPEVQAFTPKKFASSASHSKKRLTRTVKRKQKRLKYTPKTKSPQEMYNKMYVDSRILEMQRALKNDFQKKKDDCDTYGEYIASTLRKHDNKTQCMIKQAINNILFEQEMNRYENPLETDMVTEILEEP